MIKKKLSISLLLLLVVLFINLLGTISYASLSDIDIKNFILNSYCYDYTTNTYDETKLNDVLTFISNHTTEINSLVTYSQQDDANYILMYGGDILTAESLTTNLLIWITKEPIYNVDNYIYTTSGRMVARASIKASNNSFSIYTTGNSASGYSSTWKKYYANNDIYTNNNYNVVKYPAGSYPSGLLTSSYFTNDYYTFVPNIDLSNVIINGDSVPYYNFNNNSADSFVLGQLGLYKNYDYSELFEYRYQNGWKLTNIYTLNKLGTISNNIMSVRFYGSALENDTLYSLMMYSKADTDFPHIAQPFYIGSRYTKINNGVLDLDNTFSGDYYNNYNNDTNTDKIINNINSGDNETIEDIINGELSGDVNYIAVKLGWVPLDNPVSQFIRFMLYGITDSILDTDEVSIPISVHGMNLTLNSADFSIPNNTLKTFLKICLEGLFIWNLIKFEYRVFTAITTLDINAIDGTLDSADFYYNNDWRGM